MLGKIVILLLAVSSGVYGTWSCSRNQIYDFQCKDEKSFKEYFTMLSFGPEMIVCLAVGILAALTPSIVTLIIMIVMARKPLEREPTEEEIEAIQEDEDDLEKKNKKFMDNLKRKTPKPAKGKAQPMKDFAISNENVNKEDDQTVPIQPVNEAAAGGAA